MRASFFLLAGTMVLLAACDRDPMDRPGTWRPTSANEANLRVMVANPADLTQGRPLAGAYGAQASLPIERLQTGRRPALPRVTASQVGLIGLTPLPGSATNAAR